APGMPDAPDAGIDGPPPPPVGWAKAFGGAGRDVLNGIALGSNGDIVTGGSFEGTVSFGGASLASKGERDAVVVKFDMTGKHIWSKAFGGPSYDDVIAVALDSAGNVYVVGRFTTSIDVDGMPLTPNGSATNGGFVAKLDGMTGGRLWAFGFGVINASEFQQPDAIAVSADGTKLAISGQFFGTANFGGSALTHAGAGDAFVATYATANGAHLWSRAFGGTWIDEASGVAFDGSEGVIIVGHYGGPAQFGGPQPLATQDASLPSDVFVARYAASNGAYVWANGYGSNGSDSASAVRVSGGSVFVAGKFFPNPGGAISLGGSPLMTAGTNDGFVAKYDAATGSHIWSKSLGGTSDDRAIDLAATDQVWVAAEFSGTTQIGNANYTSAGISDVAYGSLGLAAGTIGASGAFGGSDVDTIAGIVASQTVLCIAGSFGQDSPANPPPIYSTTVFGNPLSGAGRIDVFIGCKAP
ncbi:MAG: SBBP repeat-containing protein, partial [bacterium]